MMTCLIEKLKLVEENMNLLNSFFDLDKLEITKVNKKSIKLLIVLVIFIALVLFFIKKDNYYVNEFTTIDGEIVLLVEKEYINTLKSANKIIINDIENSYSINAISQVDDSFMVSIKLNNTIKNINTGKYKIFIRKENLFEFIFRIIKK